MTKTRLSSWLDVKKGLNMYKYFIITYKNGLTRVMYGTEEQAKKHCLDFNATYKIK